MDNRVNNLANALGQIDSQVADMLDQCVEIGLMDHFQGKTLGAASTSAIVFVCHLLRAMEASLAGMPAVLPIAHLFGEVTQPTETPDPFDHPIGIEYERMAFLMFSNQN